MFESLTDKLELTFKRLRGQGKITETNIDDALRDVRLALLEADVHLQVVKTFLESVKTKAMGQEVLQSLSPEQQFIGIVRDELVTLLGGDFRELDLKSAPPVVIMLVGLQGSGKTTTLAKLARYLKKEKKRSPYLVPADIYRPAAIEQLKILGNELGLPVYDSDPKLSAVTICQRALEEAKKKFCDVLLIDTAGRLHIDEELMQELASIKDAVQPHQILFVADSMTGQDAVNQARGFDGKLSLSGVILTKLDGDARGGAALSIRQMVGKPILFSGIGEKLDAFEPFYPDRLASRILGMGDVLSLIDKVQQNVEHKDAERLQQAFQKQQFTLEEFQLQLQQIKRMGPVGSLLEMIPGGKKLASQVDSEKAEKELKRVEAIINSMTRQERRNPALLNGSRRRRIAEGSGTTVNDINRVMKQFLEMKKMMQRVSKLGMKSLMGHMPTPFN
ncbi:MAG: signal recognition particle protein [Deltaproteobacteria bacterium]|nr:signal recognition particle protein [Deltaproteobacteria bacterium]